MKQGELLKELRGLSREELRDRAKQIAEEMMKLRFRTAVGQLEQHHRIKGLRRDLARVLTVTRESASGSTGTEG